MAARFEPIAEELTQCSAPHVADGDRAPGLTVFSSTLSPMTTGGTLAGWAHLGEGSRASMQSTSFPVGCGFSRE